MVLHQSMQPQQAVTLYPFPLGKRKFVFFRMASCLNCMVVFVSRLFPCSREPNPFVVAMTKGTTSQGARLGKTHILCCAAPLAPTPVALAGASTGPSRPSTAESPAVAAAAT